MLCFGSGLDQDSIGQARPNPDPDPGRQKLRNFVVEEPERPL